MIYFAPKRKSKTRLQIILEQSEYLYLLFPTLPEIKSEKARKYYLTYKRKFDANIQQARSQAEQGLFHEAELALKRAKILYNNLTEFDKST